MKSLRKVLVAGVAATALALAGCQSTGTGGSVGLPSLPDIGKILTAPNVKAFERGLVCAAGNPAVGHDIQLLERGLTANELLVLGTGIVVAASAAACERLGGKPGPAA